MTCRRSGLNGRMVSRTWTADRERALRRTRGFTLVEALIVVLVVSILAVLAAVAYRRWVMTSYMAEAQDMIAQSRAAEESFRAENNAYLDISSALDLGFLYPANPPGAFRTGWGANCAANICQAHQWSALNVAPQGPVAFGYALWAANPAPGNPQAPPAPSLTLTSSPQPDLSGMNGNGQSWYIVEAVGDINGDGIYTRVYGFSTSAQLLIDNEGN